MRACLIALVALCSACTNSKTALEVVLVPPAGVELKKLAVTITIDGNTPTEHTLTSEVAATSFTLILPDRTQTVAVRAIANDDPTLDRMGSITIGAYERRTLELDYTRVVDDGGMIIADAGTTDGPVVVTDGATTDAAIADAATTDSGTDASTGPTWTLGAALSVTRSSAAAAVSGGKIYVLGGKNGPTVLSSVEMYDPVAGGSFATQSAGLLTGRYNHAAVTDGSNVINVLGGRSTISSTRINSFEKYTPTVSSVADGDNMPEGKGRDWMQAAYFKGAVYVVSGASYSGSAVEVEISTWRHIVSWIHDGGLTTPRYLAGAAVIGTNLYIAGGTTTTTGTRNAITNVERIDSNDVSNPATALPEAHSGGVLVATAGGHLIMVGGANSSETPITNVVAMKSGTTTWVQLTPLPSARSNFCAVVANDYLYVIGGERAAGDAKVMDVFGPLSGL